MKQCPNCNRLTRFQEAHDNYGIFTWHEGVQGITVDIQNFMPIKVENCSQCGYLNLYFDTSQQHQIK